MKVGKVSDSILKRSVLKFANLKDQSLREDRKCCQENKAGVGEDCAVFSWDENSYVCTATASGTFDTKHQVVYAIYRGANSIWANGGEPEALLIHIIMPPNLRESKCKEIMQEAHQVALELKLQISGGHTETCQFVTRPIVSVTVLGSRKKMGDYQAFKAQVSDDIVMTKWAGIAGTLQLKEKHMIDLENRFSMSFLQAIDELRKELSVETAVKIALQAGAHGIHDVAEGGVFGALWELAEKANVGLNVDLKKIKMKQSTVEICNFVDLNPYELMGTGALLITAKDGFHLVEELENAGIEAAVIGTITDSNDRLIFNDEEKRFLEPARNEELFSGQDSEIG